MTDFEFLHPRYLFLLLLLLPMIVWYVLRHNRIRPTLQLPDSSPFMSLQRGFRVYLRHLPFILRLFVFALLILALARPQSTSHWQNESVEGIDIMLALDISGSMLAGDFSPNRLEASKDVASSFIAGRSNDRMGLILFGGESFTQCPLTTDHAVLLNLLNEVKVGIIENQTTAIGLGLANAVKRLKDSGAKSRVIILVTDGVNNAGSVDPITAAEIAKTFGVRVYTIGVGTRGTAPYPIVDAFGNTFYQHIPVEIDEDMLRKISDMTGGNYYRATNNQKLKAIYTEIDRLERTKINVKQFSRKYEEFRMFGFLALFLLCTEALFRFVFLRSIT
jgi:Ca-activated chloride channel family protein